LRRKSRDTVERIIDCATKWNWSRLSVGEPLAKRKVFLVKSGTKVIMYDWVHVFKGQKSSNPGR